MSEATMRLPKFTKLEEVSDYFVELPGVRAQLEAKRKEVEATRRGQVKALAAAQKRREDCGALGAAFERAQEAEREAGRVLEQARGARVAAFTAIIAHTNDCDLAAQKLEAALRETADPAIGVFLEWAFAEMWDERKNGLIGSTQSNGRDPVTQKERPATVYSNQKSHEGRLAAINAAIAAAEALRFGVDADVSEQLAKIKTSIPARDRTTRRAGAIAPELSEYPELAEDRPPSFVERVLGKR